MFSNWSVTAALMSVSLLFWHSPSSWSANRLRMARSMKLCSWLLSGSQGDVRRLMESPRYTKRVASGVYSLRDRQAEIHGHELTTLSRFIAWRGGRALAIGAIGANRGVPAVDAVYVPPHSDVIENLNIKSVTGEVANGMGALNRTLSSAQRSVRACYSSQFLLGEYGFDRIDGELKTRPGLEYLEYRTVMANFLLHTLGLACESGPRPISIVIDFSADAHKYPVLLKAAEFFLEPWPGYENDTLLRIDDDRVDLGDNRFTKVLNLSSMIRRIDSGDPVKSYYFLFANQMLHFHSKGFELFTEKGALQSSGP